MCRQSKSRTIYIADAAWLREVIESINYHMSEMTVMIDDVSRGEFIANLLQTKLANANAYIDSLSYIYTTSAFNTRCSYRHFELFDDMVCDLFSSEMMETMVARIKHISEKSEIDSPTVTVDMTIGGIVIC